MSMPLFQPPERLFPLAFSPSVPPDRPAVFLSFALRFRHNCVYFEDKETNDLRLDLVHEIVDSGLDVLPVIHRRGLDEVTAFEAESPAPVAFPFLRTCQYP